MMKSKHGYKIVFWAFVAITIISYITLLANILYFTFKLLN